MPELPEVESLRRILARSAVGRTIVAARVTEPRLRRTVARRLGAELERRRIERLERRAKYLLVRLSGDLVLLVHLGMSGSLTHRHPGFDANGFDPRHDHVHLALDDGSALIYNDPRRFGLMKLVAATALDSIVELRGLGPEPIGGGFDAAYLISKARGRKGAIKNLIMDQRIVAGIGNIYASEILFRAKVRPTRRAGSLTRAELTQIAEFTPTVLREAIGGRGTTFRSYRDSSGQPGRYAARLLVYGREGEPCRSCGKAIKNVTVGQRASFYCPGCQR